MPAAPGTRLWLSGARSASNSVTRALHVNLFSTAACRHSVPSSIKSVKNNILLLFFTLVCFCVANPFAACSGLVTACASVHLSFLQVCRDRRSGQQPTHVVNTICKHITVHVIACVRGQSIPMLGARMRLASGRSVSALLGVTAAASFIIFAVHWQQREERQVWLHHCTATDSAHISCSPACSCHPEQATTQVIAR